MAENSKIEWTHHTFNPWVGCRHISNGDQGACVNCYAFDWAKRAGRDVWGDSPRQRTTAENWKLPQRWNDRLSDGERARVFCASLADVFDNEVPAKWRDDLFTVIQSTPRLDWLLLTKRIGNVQRMIPANWFSGYPNIWLGITVVTQEEADRDVPKLIDLRCHKRFLSCEPLQGPIDLASHLGMWWNPTMGVWEGNGFHINRDPWGNRKIDWVIAGGESGSCARPMEVRWCESLQEQCEGAGMAFFMKQMSRANWPHYKDFSTFPESLRVRQFP
jgi:protein gp37